MTAAKPSRRRWWREAAGLTWVGVAGIVTLLPTLVHGASLGVYHQLAFFGLLQRPGAHAHGYLQSTDQVWLIIPWKALSWTQVHHGHLPLWNKYSVLGMPLAFNWESAPFSLQALLGYIGPLHLAYTISVVSTLVIGGTGVYVLGRVLGLGVIGSATAGTVFELSGPFFLLAGWQDSVVMCFAGWLFAETVLILRGRHRVRHVAGFAVAFAFAGLGGQPETFALLTLALGTFLVVLLAWKVVRGDALRSIIRPARDLLLAGLAGLALFAPLLLPAVQLSRISVRSHWSPIDAVSSTTTLVKGRYLAQALSVHDLTHVLFSSFDGVPVATGQWFADRYGYVDTVAYVGIVAVVLSIVAVVVRRRNPYVVALAVLTTGMAALVFFPPVVSIADHLPVVGSFLWNRAALPMAFGVAVLAGYGADLLARRAGDRPVVRTFAWTSGAAAVLMAALWLFGRGKLPAVEASVRSHSFAWPVVGTVLLLAVAVALWGAYAARSVAPGMRARIGRASALVLLAGEGAFLVAGGVPLWSSGHTFLPTTPAQVQLQRAVGDSLVGFGSKDCVFPPGLGLRENVNVAYGVRELAVYDPMTPYAYFTSWQVLNGTSGGYLIPNIFCPAITSADLGRRYGVGYVLTSAQGPAPAGATFDRNIGNEKLYRIPGASLATVSALGAGGRFPGLDAPGRAARVTDDGAGSYRIHTDAEAASVLRLRITDVPGWHASLDGKPLALKRYAGVMLQARLPAGRHVVELHYWPAEFTIGLVLAACAAAGLLGAACWARLAGRRSG